MVFSILTPRQDRAPSASDDPRVELRALALADLVARTRTTDSLQRGVAAQVLAERVRARPALAAGDLENVCDALALLFYDPVDTVRADALVAMTHARGAKATFAYARLLHDESPLCRAVAAETLCDFPDRAAADILADLAVNDDDDDVAFQAARALAELRDERAVEPLLAQLNDPPPGGRYHILRALRRIGSKDALPVLERFMRRLFINPAERIEAAGGVARAGGTRGYTLLRSALTGKHMQQRGLAIEIAGDLRDRDLLVLVERIARDDNDRQRSNAMLALAEAQRDDLETLFRDRANHDPDEEVRADALRALHRIQARALAATLAQRAADPSPEVQTVVEEIAHDLASRPLTFASDTLASASVVAAGKHGT